MTADRPVRVGNCSGFLGDRLSAAQEMVSAGEIDVLTGDWLAELTMLILQKQRSRDPRRGYAATFVEQLQPLLGTIADQGIKVVSNAGGLVPRACAEAVSSIAREQGLDLKVAYVTGDDLMPGVEGLLAEGALHDFRSGRPLDLRGRQPMVANAYLGGWSVAECLSRGADIVVTGRLTDASVVVGPSAWWFGWARDDWDALAGAVVAGHIVECGAQATGGNFSFFTELPDRVPLGFPIAEIAADGSATICKPVGTGGAVSVDTVVSQLLYEIQGTTYLNPDVAVRLDSISLAEAGPDRVRVEGAKGGPPPRGLKVGIGVPGGFRNAMTMVLTGGEREEKADFALRAVEAQVPGGWASFDSVRTELLGTPKEDADSFGDGYSMLRVAVSGDDEALVGRTFSSAVIEVGLSSYPGFFTLTPPGPATSFARYVPALVDTSRVEVFIHVDGECVRIEHPQSVSASESPQGDGDADSVGGARSYPRGVVRLGELVGARSGDKGGDINVGMWARSPEIWAWLDEEFDIDALRAVLPESEGLTIRRYRFPRIRSLNFVVEGFLGDGVSSCLMLDSQGKGVAEFLRNRRVSVPAGLAGGAP